MKADFKRDTIVFQNLVFLHAYYLQRICSQYSVKFMINTNLYTLFFG